MPLGRLLFRSLPRKLKEALTATRMRWFERVSLDGYFDHIVPDTPRDWEAQSRRDAAAHQYYGLAPTPSFTNRAEYKKKIAWDLDRIRHDLRRRLGVMLYTYGVEGYDEKAMAEVCDRLWMRTSRPLNIMDVLWAVTMLPIVHQTTKHIGMPSTVMTTRGERGLPVVVLTSFFNDMLLFMATLMVRRTVRSVGPQHFRLREEREDIVELQSHARMLLYLTGIWIAGEPYAKLRDEDDKTKQYVMERPESEPAIGSLIASVKSGWCAFEALHEFGHIVFGDWLRPAETWTLQEEICADRFAAACLALEQDSTTKVWMLAGAVAILNVIGVAEHVYQCTSPVHSRAVDRAATLQQTVFPLFTSEERELFVVALQMELLPKFAYIYADQFSLD